MEKHYFAAGIDENVAAQLPNIRRREPGPPPLKEATEVGPDGRQPKDTARRPFLKAKGPVSLALRIGQHRKGKFLSPGELQKEWQRLKADSHYLTAQRLELVNALAQLRQMSASGHSPQPPQEHQKDGTPSLHRQSPLTPLNPPLVRRHRGGSKADIGGRLSLHRLIISHECASDIVNGHTQITFSPIF